MKKTYGSFITVFMLFIIWVLASLIIDNAIIMPTPYATFKAFFAIFTHAEGIEVITMTLFRLLIALFFATVSGVLLGVVSGLNPPLRLAFRPVVTLLRTVPVISIVVILLIVFGFSLTPYLITFLMIFPLIFQSISDGIENLDKELVDVFKLEDNDPIDAIRYCYLPLIGPQIKTAMLQAAGLGIKVLVMAEYLAQTKNSVGNALYLAKVNLNYDEVFAWTLFLILLAVVLEHFIRRFSNLKPAILHNDIFSRE